MSYVRTSEIIVLDRRWDIYENMLFKATYHGLVFCAKHINL